MRTKLFIGLLIMFGALIAAGPAAADSFLTYPDGSGSQAIDLGNGNHAFVFIDRPGDDDIFIHPVNFFANLLFVSLSNTFAGFGIWLDFDGFTSGGFARYFVRVCSGSPGGCNFGGDVGTFFLSSLP